MIRIAQRTVLVILAGAMLALAAAACDDDGNGGSDDATPAANTPAVLSDFPVTLERSDGQMLTLEEAPQRIAALSAGHVETLFAIGAGEQIIAVDVNSDYPPEAQAIEPRLDAFAPSVEAIAATDPDLVIISFDADGIVGALDDLGIPVFFDDINSEITTIDGVFESIVEMGRATGHNEEAGQLVSELRERVDAVEVVVAEIDEGPRIFHELDIFDGFNSAGPGDFVGDLYNTLHAVNIVTADEGPYPTLQSEAVIERNPEYIFLADAEFGQTPDVVAARPGWGEIDAVRNERLYPIDTDASSRPGPRIVDALEELAAILYPDLFPDEEASARCLACSAVPA